MDEIFNFYLRNFSPDILTLGLVVADMIGIIGLAAGVHKATSRE